MCVSVGVIGYDRGLKSNTHVHIGNLQIITEYEVVFDRKDDRMERKPEQPEKIRCLHRKK